MPRTKDPVTGKFTKMPLPQLQEDGNPTVLPSEKSEESENKSEVEITFTKDPKEASEKKAADKTVNEFVEGLKKFTKSLKESKFGKAAMAAGSAVISGAKSAAGVIRERAHQAGFSKEDLVQDIGMDSPLLKAAAGLTLDAGGALAKGAGKMVLGGGKMLMGGAKKLFGFGKKEEKGDKKGILEKIKGDDESGESVSSESSSDKKSFKKLKNIDKSVTAIKKIMERNEKKAGRARLQNMEKERESGIMKRIMPGKGDGEKKGSGGGMLAGLLGAGSIIGGLFSGAGGGMIKIVTTLFGAIGNVFSGLMGLATKIPMLVSKAMPFLKQGAKFFKQIFKKLFWPVTAILAAMEFIDGFIAGYKEGGILEGIKQGFESVINSFIDVPLNMLKNLVAWAAGKLGFENIEESLNSFDFDFSSIVGDGLQFLFDFIADIPNKLKQMFVDLVKGFGGERAAKLIGIDVDAMQEEIDTDRKERTILREERDKRTAERRAAKAKKDSGVEPAASETSSGTESGLEKQTAAATAPEPYQEYMARWSRPDGDYYDEETGLTFLNEDSYEAARDAYELEKRAYEITSKGGTRGKFSGGELVSVDGKDVQPASSQRDSRGVAASQIQDAAMAASGGGGSAPIVSVTTTDNSQKKGGTTIVPGTLNTETDPFMSQISNADF